MRAQLTPVDPILRVQDICALLKISESAFYELKARGWFGGEGPALIEVQPQIDRHPRFSGEPFVKWLSDRTQLRLVRAALRVAQ